MNLPNKKKILTDAIESWKNNKGRFNYMSLKNATTVDELEKGMDIKGNLIYIKSNLDKQIIHFGEPSKFNDKREFEFVCPELAWLGFLIQSNSEIKKFKNAYSQCKNFDKALKVLNPCTVIKTTELRRKLKKLGKTCADKYKDNYGIFCLTPSCYNTYFWKKYCNNYNGICCEYDIDAICSNNKNIIRTKVVYNNAGIAYLPEYVNIDNFPEFNTSNLTDELKSKLGTDSEKSKDVILQLMTTKPRKWIQELETRLIIMIKSSDNTTICSRDINAFPLKIYVGYKTSDELKKYFKDYCMRHRISYEIIDNDMCIDFKLEGQNEFKKLI